MGLIVRLDFKGVIQHGEREQRKNAAEKHRTLRRLRIIAGNINQVNHQQPDSQLDQLRQTCQKHGKA